MTVRAADLAEQIVDEISQSDQDWGAIELHARELVELLARRRGRSADLGRADGGAAQPARLDSSWPAVR